MHRIVETYGKQATKQLLDHIVIAGRVDNDIAYDILRKNKIINGRIKEVFAGCTKGRYSGRLNYFLRINSASRELVRMSFYEDEIPQILESCKDETE